MAKFFLKIGILLLPFIVFFLLMESYCRTQTTFAIKKKFLEKNEKSIETLVLGSSHSQKAINPYYLKSKTCNLAFAGQPISIDYYLFNKYINSLPKLKTVVFELSIFSFYNDLEISDPNGHIYANLYNINYKTEPFSLKNYSLVYSDFQFFSSIFYAYCNPSSFKYKINEYGFTTNSFQGRFKNLNYNKLMINNSFIMLHNFKSEQKLNLNKAFFLKLIKKALQKHLKVIILTPPLYKTYRSHIPKRVTKEIHGFTSDIMKKYNLKYFDYSHDKRFNIYDYEDDNHLNSSGAKKLSKIINKEIFS